MRSATSLAQARGTFLTVAFSPLVAGLPVDVEIRAQRREREAACGRETDELMFLFHEGYLLPGHSLKVYPMSPDKVLPMSPVHTSYLSLRIEPGLSAKAH